MSKIERTKNGIITLRGTTYDVGEQYREGEAATIRGGEISAHALNWWTSKNGSYVSTAFSSEFDDDESEGIAKRVLAEFTGKAKLERIAGFFEMEIESFAVVEDNFVGQGEEGEQKSYVIGMLRSEIAPAWVTFRLGAWISGAGGRDPILEILTVEPQPGRNYAPRWVATYRPSGGFSLKAKMNCGLLIKGSPADLSLLIPIATKASIERGISFEEAYQDLVISH